MSTSSFQNPRYSSCKSSFSTPSSPASPPTSSHPQNQRPFTFLSISFFLLFFDAVLTSLIIHATSYTEIDYGTYLSQAHAADLGGERNYYNIGGPSGPCVYPAAHLYIFAIVGRATRWAGMLIEGVREREDNDGLTELRPAQYIFAVIYLATLAAVLWIYGECWSEGKKTMDGVVGIRRRSTLRRIGRLLRSICIPALTLTLSRRIHSLYVLRLFNDCIASLFFYIAVGLFVSAGKRHGDGLDRPHWNRWSRWHTGCIAYSLGVGVKMNVLLSAPGLLLLLLQGQRGIAGTISCLATCAAVQLIIGAPFLLQNPTEYLSRAFQFSRVFLFKWTVNWKFLPEDMFVSPALSVSLLLLHLSTLILFASKWISATRLQTKNASALFVRVKDNRPFSPSYIAYTLFVSNFIGIVFARTLHYQFYVWYFHSLPLMLYIASSSSLSQKSGTNDGLILASVADVACRMTLTVVVEVAFNIFPATPSSSAMLQVAHLCILLILYQAPVPDMWHGGNIPAIAEGKSISNRLKKN